MKILLLHSDFLEFEAVKKAIKEPEPLKEKKARIGQCLAVFISVEKRDEANPKSSAQRLAAHIREVAEQVKEKTVVLYPYVHLSNEPSSPKAALEVLDAAESALKGLKVHRSPFGWYKGFSIKVKGHPLAELSREFGPEEAEDDETESLKQERKLTSYWHVLTEDGKLHDIDKFDYRGYEKLKKFALYEKEKTRAVKEETPHAKLMRRLEIADYEPASDGGNLRFYPKGRLIKKLLEEYVTDKVVEYGGVEVETPIMYDIQHSTLSKYLQRFPARQYQIESDKRTFFLRFAACFGQFLIAHDATISYRHLPLKLYELTRYSFRREQSGELTGLRRLRAFTMPDVHALVSDLDQAMDEFKVRFDLCRNVLDGIGIGVGNTEMALRTTKDFYKKNTEFLVNLAKAFGKPIILELWDERIFYFILKYDFNYVDNLDKASALSTDQIDIENGERYGMEFTDKDGNRQNPIVLHCSPSGAIERAMYALLEQAAEDEKGGKTPLLPLWLNPTQVRVVPVSASFHDFALNLTDLLRERGIRADIDDRTLHVGKKIRQAETEWCGCVVVVGEKEQKGGKLPVRVRGKKGLVEMTEKELIDYIRKSTKDMPFKPLALPKELSKRPSFVG